jgi:hypothetical protein
VRFREADCSAFFGALEACLEGIHARGVAHLDLRQRRNILCGPDGVPRVLDFEAALVCDPARVAGRFLLSWGRRIDRLAVLKHKARYAPGTLTAGERRLARSVEVWRWLWPSTLLHRVRVALRRRGRAAGGS